jgi:hypothetical protein
MLLLGRSNPVKAYCPFPLPFAATKEENGSVKLVYKLNIAQKNTGVNRL